MSNSWGGSLGAAAWLRAPSVKSRAAPSRAEVCVELGQLVATRNQR